MVFAAISALTLLLTACDSQDEPKNYVFDKKLHRADIQKYTISDQPRAEMGCKFFSTLLMKKALQAMKEGKKLDLSDLSKMNTPATIKVYDDKIEWIDTGEDTPIVENVVVLTSKISGRNITFSVRRDGESFSLGVLVKEDGLDCIFPFKKIEG